MQKVAADFVFRNATLGLWLKHFLFILFFFSVGLVEPVRFDSVQSVSYFRNRNQTEPELFCDFLIGQFGFFLFGFLGYFFPGFIGLLIFFSPLIMINMYVYLPKKYWSSFLHEVSFFSEV